MSDIDRILELIHWNRTDEEQQKGIDLASDMICIKAFFQPSGPNGGKGVWDNCAEIVCRRPDEELKYYISDMLLWLEDLNWPGAERILQRLIEFQDVNWLSMSLNHMVPALSLLGERSWLFFLSDLLENEKLREALRPEVVKTLNAIRKEFLKNE